ncbi:MAG: Asparagine synthetase [candidate division TM6 bacterium GW2011_GWE2_31_21]|nr:MAG: Asparagine synthetase [candidate division TM6 bacterium GW2011_GWE2_31_21]KKP53929.1 MAG: Asparagine synthetase [candidate division TM6 bacterium GW2011_GWF2_33_332]
MCGIAGIIVDSSHSDFQKLTIDFSSDIKLMTESISHRGMDSGNYFIDDEKGCFLGHRRLSIIDLSDVANQPMDSLDGRYKIIFNGEIYNYQQLTSELEAEGVKFVTKSDTEVLLNLYILYGKSCLKNLRGMFSFAIWDSNEKRLFAARDHLGKKPFNFIVGEKGGVKYFAFSSELKSFSNLSFYKKELNLAAVNEYLSFYSINAPDSFYKDVYALPPAHFAEFKDGNLEIGRYWDLREIQTNCDLNLHQIKTNLRDLVKESVRLRMRADVPVGAFLSGGLDSTTIVGLMSTLTDIPVKTFSIGFEKEGSYIDELSLASKVAKKFGCDHHETIISGTQFKKVFNDFIYYIDQPSGDGINGFLVSQVAAQHVKVSLSGLGGDEVFLGYRYFQDLLRLQKFDGSFNKKFISIFADLFNKNKIFRSLAYKTGFSFLRFYGLKDKDIYLQMRSIFQIDEKEKLVKNKDILKFDYLSKASNILDPIFSRSDDFLNKFSKSELSWYTPGMLLKDSDVTAMAFTLEVRVPFLDKNLVECLLTVPSKYKIYEGQKYNKPLLANLFDGLIPAEILNFPKHGFEMPIGFWLIKHFEKELNYLQNVSFLNQEYVKKLVCDLRRNPKNYLKVWTLLVLCKWLEKQGFEIA